MKYAVMTFCRVDSWPALPSWITSYFSASTAKSLALTFIRPTASADIAPRVSTPRPMQPSCLCWSRATLPFCSYGMRGIRSGSVPMRSQAHDGTVGNIVVLSMAAIRQHESGRVQRRHRVHEGRRPALQTIWLNLSHSDLANPLGLRSQVGARTRVKTAFGMAASAPPLSRRPSNPSRRQRLFSVEQYLPVIITASCPQRGRSHAISWLCWDKVVSKLVQALLLPTPWSGMTGPALPFASMLCMLHGRCSYGRCPGDTSIPGSSKVDQFHSKLNFLIVGLRWPLDRACLIMLSSNGDLFVARRRGLVDLLSANCAIVCGLFQNFQPGGVCGVNWCKFRADGIRNEVTSGMLIER